MKRPTSDRTPPGHDIHSTYELLGVIWDSSCSQGENARGGKSSHSQRDFYCLDIMEFVAIFRDNDPKFHFSAELPSGGVTWHDTGWI